MRTSSIACLRPACDRSHLLLFKTECDRSHPALFKGGIGINLYEMLTGKLLFPSNDSLERVYSHIAVPPIYPHQIYSEIPAAISERVMNLLANAIDCFEESNQDRTYAEIAA